MRIGILQTGHSPDEVRDDLGDYSDMFARLLGDQTREFITFSVVDGQFPAGPHDADAWLITGSKHSAYEDLDWIAQLEALIRDIRDANVPLIGVCFGHQIIAQALGGRVELFSGGWVVGRQTYQTAQGDLTLNAWHRDQVVELPEGAKVFASNEYCANAGFVIGDRIMTIQPHPEYDSDFIDVLIRYRGQGVIPDDILSKAKETLHQPIDKSGFVAQMGEVLNKGAAK